MISYFSWSRGFDPDDFMIYFPKTRDSMIPLTEIPWSGDLTHRISMIRWSYPAKYNPLIPFFSSLRAHEKCIQAEWIVYVKLVLDPKVK